MPLAEPDPHTVRELPLERLTTCPIEADRADRHLHRYATSLVERGQMRHARSLSRACVTQLSRSATGLCQASKWHTRRVPLGFEHTHVADPTESLARSRARGRFSRPPGSIRGPGAFAERRRRCGQVALAACATWHAPTPVPGAPRVGGAP